MRVLAMLLIVTMHITGKIFPLEEYHNTINCWNISLFIGLRSFLFLGVSFFSFLTGYFGTKWNLQKAIKYELMAISIGGGILLLSIFVFHSLKIRLAFALLTPLISRGCWYYSAYIVLMLVAPFLNEGVKVINQKTFTIILFILIFISYIGNFVYNRDSTQFTLLFVIYMLGQYLRKYPVQFLTTTHATIILATTLTLNFLLTFVFSYFFGFKIVKYLENNYNPLLITSSVCIF